MAIDGADPGLYQKICLQYTSFKRVEIVLNVSNNSFLIFAVAKCDKKISFRKKNRKKI